MNGWSCLAPIPLPADQRRQRRRRIEVSITFGMETAAPALRWRQTRPHEFIKELENLRTKRDASKCPRISLTVDHHAGPLINHLILANGQSFQGHAIEDVRVIDVADLSDRQRRPGLCEESRR